MGQNVKEKLSEEGIKNQPFGLKWSEARKIIDGKLSGHNTNKCMYVSMPDGIHLIKQLYVDDNGGIVLSIEDSCFTIISYPTVIPSSPRFELTRDLPYSFRVDIYSGIEYLADRKIILSNDGDEI